MYDYYNEIALSVVFDYKKEIRRYLYDFEIFLRTNELLTNILPIPPIPDEFDPLGLRFMSVYESDSEVVTFKISQTNLIMSVVFKTELPNLHTLKETIFPEKLEVFNKIKAFIQSQVKDFNIKFETVYTVKNYIEKEIEKVSIDNINIDNINIDDIRNAISREYEDKFYIMEQNTIFKTYEITDLNNIFQKNNKSNFLGWNINKSREVSSRLFYNLNTNNDITYSIDINELIELLLKQD